MSFARAYKVWSITCFECYKTFYYTESSHPKACEECGAVVIEEDDDDNDCY
jgi:rRNA maturation endonuclease Nob1